MYKHAAFIFLTLFIVPTISLADSADALKAKLKQEEEVEHKQAIATDPNSEDAHFQYASFLFGEDRLDEAEKELNVTLKLNSEHSVATKMKEEISALREIDDPVKRASRKLTFTLETLSSQMKELTGVLNQAPEEREQARKEKHKKLDQKYKISSYESNEPFIKEVFDLRMVSTQFKIKGQYGEVEKILKRILTEHGDLPSAHHEYVVFLVDRGRYPEARSNLTELQKKFPDYPFAKIVNDFLTKIEKTTSTERKNSLKLDLSMTLLDARLIALDNL